MTVILGTILVFALVDSLNPSVIGVTLYLLLTGGAATSGADGAGTTTLVRHGTTTKVLTYVGTVAGTYFTIGVALMLGLSALSDQIAAAAEHPVTYALVGALGVGMLVWSLVDSHRDKRHPDRHAGKRSRTPVSDRLGALVSLGLVVTLLEFSTAMPFLAAIGLMTAEGFTVGTWLPVLAGYTVVMNLPPVLLLAAHKLLSDRIQDRLERWRDKLTANSRKTMQWIIGIVGFLLARYGIVLLLAELGVAGLE